MRALTPGLRGPAAALLAACLMVTALIARASETPKPRPPEIERARSEAAVVLVQGDRVYYTGNMWEAAELAFDMLPV